MLILTTTATELTIIFDSFFTNRELRQGGGIFPGTGTVQLLGKIGCQTPVHVEEAPSFLADIVLYLQPAPHLQGKSQGGKCDWRQIWGATRWYGMVCAAKGIAVIKGRMVSVVNEDHPKVNVSRV